MNGNPVETAVILAAGRGTRLGDLGKEIPKGFLQLGEKPIVEESIERLVEVGIRRVVIVTGHLASFYERLASRSAGLIEIVHNDEYAQSGSFLSLSLALDRVDSPFLLLESDLIYESRAVIQALEHPADSLILISAASGAGDEVWVETDAAGRLVRMSKELQSLSKEPAGELVGIAKIGLELALALRQVAESIPEGLGTLEYEATGLVEAARTCPIQCLKLENLLWAEIDDESHLSRAESHVYRLIQ